MPKRKKKSSSRHVHKLFVGVEHTCTSLRIAVRAPASPTLNTRLLRRPGHRAEVVAVLQHGKKVVNVVVRIQIPVAIVAQTFSNNRKASC